MLVRKLTDTDQRRSGEARTGETSLVSRRLHGCRAPASFEMAAASAADLNHLTLAGCQPPHGPAIRAFGACGARIGVVLTGATSARSRGPGRTRAARIPSDGCPNCCPFDRP